MTVIMNLSQKLNQTRILNWRQRDVFFSLVGHSISDPTEFLRRHKLVSLAISDCLHSRRCNQVDIFIELQQHQHEISCLHGISVDPQPPTTLHFQPHQ